MARAIGARIEMLKVPSGVRNGEGYPLPSLYTPPSRLVCLKERRELPSGRKHILRAAERLWFNDFLQLMCSKKFIFSRYGCILVIIKGEVRSAVSPLSVRNS